MNQQKDRHTDRQTCIQRQQHKDRQTVIQTNKQKSMTQSATQSSILQDPCAIGLWYICLTVQPTVHHVILVIENENV